MKKENLKLFIDYNEADPKALNQMYEAIKHDWVIDAAVMPDVHLGYGLPIGGVAATKDMVVPSWIGFDVGCGMMALSLSIKKDKVIEHRDAIFKEIYKHLPVGRNWHKEAVASEEDIKSIIECSPGTVSNALYKEIKQTPVNKQIGSLGSGNHFCEISYSSTEPDRIWLVVHSGSRNLGHTMATYYMKAAAESKNAKEGTYPIPADSLLGIDYINDVHFLESFAILNRSRIADIIISSLNNALGSDTTVLNKYHQYESNNTHNHLHFRDGMWIHRKGATQAYKGQMGIIPINMRDGAFIVRGLGNPESLCSSSHGAGRRMSRGEARKTLSMKDFADTMKDVTAKVTKSTLNESPEAYKSYDMVMHAQKDLIEIKDHLMPIINIKG